MQADWEWKLTINPTKLSYCLYCIVEFGKTLLLIENILVKTAADHIPYLLYLQLIGLCHDFSFRVCLTRYGAESLFQVSFSVFRNNWIHSINGTPFSLSCGEASPRERLVLIWKADEGVGLGL